ncbi:MAG TPA: AAA family ATPase [Thermoleophilaceae bacterium]|nr:AAA family ATPase [Thermoleophilaceae bacterium]
MHLRSLTLKGFKSFPDRTKLDFAPGVSVVVGPNGSGKSNITDAVLWALGEQSPLAVRGQTMQDVIFAGGAGVPSRNAAEVEVLLDNSDGSADSDFSEISIMRKLSRDGEGEYRLNGARCRMVDVLEVLSDTGLGKEMHSVVSQGRVESIIHSKPRDRRLLIEEAAGLGKHRKRRRRAQLKLERTQDNLARALDVEREARSRLRPLKRQAEAAELHQRLERQSLEAGLELAADDLRSARADLANAEAAAAQAGAARDEAERLLAEVAERREAAEEAFAEHSRARERLSSSLFAARAAADGIALRADRAHDAAGSAAEDAARDRRDAEELAGGAAGEEDTGSQERIAALEAELSTLDSERDTRLEDEFAELEQDRVAAEGRREEATAAVDGARAAILEAEQAVEEARGEQRQAERREESARAAAAKAGSELATVNHFLSTAAAAPDDARTLAAELEVDEGFELAVAAALGSRLRAGVVASLGEGQTLLDGLRDGGSAIVAAHEGRGADGRSPAAGAARILDHVRPPADLAPVVERLLGDAWLVDDLAAVPRDFTGVAVTPRGRAFFGASGELRQAPAGGEERILEARASQHRLITAAQEAAGEEAAATEAVAHAAALVSERLERREAARTQAQEAGRALDEADELLRRATRRIELRRSAPEEGQAAVRRARVEADLGAERRLADRAQHERAEREQRIARLRSRAERCAVLATQAERAATVLERAADAVAVRRDALAEQLAADEEVGRRTADELRACARGEVEIQAQLKAASDAVTQAEVRAQQARDVEHESAARLTEIAAKLELPAEPAGEPLAAERREELAARVERLARRREQLGPVNPLAEQEYEEAIAHVEELETQRGDLEQALTELEGLIKETDRRIREAFEQTFEQAARNFEEVVGHLFPGGRGRLRLVSPEGPKPVLGGEEVAAEQQAEEAEEAAAEAEEQPDEDAPGVEVEVTPAGKSMKKLSLLSGGEKSLVALAFMFAVFLARPCPFYILDEVEAALDDLNIDRFLQLIHRYSDRAQFIIVTHQKRTMDAADVLYGVSMGGNGVSKVVSRRLPERERSLEVVQETDEAAA